MTLRIGYMTGEYLRTSPFTFVHRELAALRALGVHVETFSVRAERDATEDASPEHQAEAASTYVLLPLRPLRLLAAHARLLFGSPRRYLAALRLAARTRGPGLAALGRQIAYFLEAALVARRMRARSLTHLHNHFANSSCSVAMLAAALGGFSFSFTIHGPSIFFEPGRWRIDEKARRSAFVCCISHFCRSQTMIWTPVEVWNRLHIVHCGVNPDEYKPVAHQGRGSRLVFVGRLASVKGIPVLFEALRRLRAGHPGLRVTLLGDGPERAQLEALASRLGVRDCVEFAGYRSQAAVRAALAESDVFVLPSFAEGVPVVAMEAMATGLPVVATRVAGVAELVEEGRSGFLVPPGDPESLADAVGKLLQDPELRARFGRAGRAQVEREFDVRQEARRLERIVRAAVEGRAVPAADEGPRAPLQGEGGGYLR